MNDQPLKKKDYVLYWMQRSQRAEENHALAYAVQQANALNQPLLVIFGLSADYPEANLAHYTFMLEGLQETEQSLVMRGIKLVVRIGKPAEVALEAGQDASLIVCDRGYLRHLRAWREQVARQADCGVVQVESDVVVPIEVVSNKAEYAARTIRPKIHRHLADFMVALRTVPLEKDSLGLKQAGLDLSSVPAIVDQLKLTDQPGPAVGFFRGGTSEGKRIFRAFLEQRLASYNKNRNQPQTDDVSHMSKYLHFGQISPLFLALEAEEKGKSAEDVDTFIEELVVRRDLAINFVYYTKDYDQYRCLPNWAQETLQAHTADERDVIYSRSELEQAQTHDPYWNAAQNEMRCTGYMHNYMRMYWGKKILEWSRTPKEAFRVALSLNNQYFIDGRDPNSFAGVGWVFGLHDRPWKERPIFGKIRYMAASGLERKADMAAYLKKVEQLMETAQEKQQGQ